MTCLAGGTNREGHHTEEMPISSKVSREYREGPGTRHVRMDSAVATQEPPTHPALPLAIDTHNTHTLAHTLLPQGALGP